ncbi:alpha/beta hydrolase family protein [Clostridium sp. WILCCON 0269]|uniref:Alpha/beta hydrolase family protein n=1 Tax=Candidatus Clostridium eludens TaxID=3381663 RepID=A0ABW8SPT0_9CLOT
MVDNFEIRDEQSRNIRGIINRPDISGKVPCIIFCHGFMGNKLGHNFMFVKIARTLEKLNIASIRFDFMGSGESDGDFKDVTISSEVQDCEKVLQFANSLDYIDKDNINILGFSMGAAIAVIIASTYSHIIKNSILMSAGFNMYDIFISEATGDKLYEFLEKGYINFENNILSEKAIEDAFNYRVFDYLKGMRGNTLIVHGTEDKSVYPLYAKKIHELLGSKSKLKFIKGSDHCYSSPEYYEELIKAIVEFVMEHIL